MQKIAKCRKGQYRKGQSAEQGTVQERANEIQAK